jgi:DNA repair protein RecO
LAGETVKTSALCLRIAPWSKTSHVVTWLTPSGKVATLVKGAVRPKSAFLGQYDLNYTCEVVYYRGGPSEVKALRECSSLDMRTNLRSNFRLLAVAEYYRSIVSSLVPWGEEAKDWLELLEKHLSFLECDTTVHILAKLIMFELSVLKLAGLNPGCEMENNAFYLRGEGRFAVSGQVAECLLNPVKEKKLKILLETCRVIGVFYMFHLDCSLETRQSVLNLIYNNEKEKERNES